MKEVGAARALFVCNVLWCLGIVYSAMATRQHVALDVVAGAALAGVAWIVYAGAYAYRVPLPAWAGGRSRPRNE